MQQKQFILGLGLLSSSDNLILKRPIYCQFVAKVSYICGLRYILTQNGRKNTI